VGEFLLVPAYPGSPGPTAVKRLCVCVCVCVCVLVPYISGWVRSLARQISTQTSSWTHAHLALPHGDVLGGTLQQRLHLVLRVQQHLTNTNKSTVDSRLRPRSAGTPQRVGLSTRRSRVKSVTIGNESVQKIIINNAKNFF